MRNRFAIIPTKQILLFLTFLFVTSSCLVISPIVPDTKKHQVMY